MVNMWLFLWKKIDLFFFFFFLTQQDIILSFMKKKEYVQDVNQIVK